MVLSALSVAIPPANTHTKLVYHSFFFRYKYLQKFCAAIFNSMRLTCGASAFIFLYNTLHGGGGPPCSTRSLAVCFVSSIFNTSNNNKNNNKRYNRHLNIIIIFFSTACSLSHSLSVTLAPSARSFLHIY